jgi:transposase
MAAKRKLYTAEFKRDAVSLITDHGYGVSEAARNLGLHANMLRKWKRKWAPQGANACPGNGRLSPDQEELQRQRQENKRLRMAREILQKAALFFANEAQCDLRLSPRRNRAGRCPYCAR